MKTNRPGQVALALTLLFGMGLTVWGLSQQVWPSVLPWGGLDALKRYVMFMVVTALFVVSGAKWLRKEPLVIGGGLAVAGALLSGALWPLAVVLWFALASAILGRGVLAVLRVKNCQTLPTSFLVGAGIYGTAVGLIAHFPVNYSGIYGAALAAPLILGRRTLLTLFVAGRARCAAIEAGASTEWWLGICVAVVGLVHFVVALMPEVGFDALALHLLVPVHLATRHEWGFDPSFYAMALIPMLGDWLFSIGYMLAGETGARLINLAFTYLLAWQGREAILWAGGNEKGAKWAALLFLATPLTFLETSSLFVEGVWAAYVVAGVMTMFRLVSSVQKNGATELKIGGLMLGFAVAAKALTLNILPALLLLLLYRLRSWLNRDIGGAFIFGLVLFLAVGAIPYSTAWLIAGNPVHPFFNGIFKSPYYPPINFDNSLFKSGVTWDLPYRVIFDSGKYLEASSGASGFQWLLLLPGGLAILLLQGNRRALLLFVVAALSVVSIFHSQSYLRYVYPASLLLTTVIGVALSSGSEQSGMLRRAFPLVAGGALGLNLLFFSSATWSYRDLPLDILLSDSSRGQYLESRLPVRRAVEFVNYLNVEQVPVAFFSQPFGAGLNADALYPNWYNYRFEEGIEKARDAQEVISMLSQYGANFVLLDAGWGTLEKRKIIEQATDRIAEFGPISVRAVRVEYRFGKELLNNPELTGSEGWSLSQGVIVAPDAGTFVVTVSAPASQVVKVRGGIRYINEVTARCGPTPGQGRVQVNWHDAKMQFITTSIQVFDCTSDWQDHRQLLTAPKNAVFGIVYGSSHTSTPIEITRISLR